MSDKLSAGDGPANPIIYTVHLEGHLDSQWAEWFGEVELQLLEDGTTLLTCPVADQAALHGLLRKVRDLGRPLIKVERLAAR